MKINNPVLAVIVGLSAAIALTSCDSGAPGDAAANNSPAASPRPAASAADPAIREAVSAAPAFDVGHTVHITSAGIQPRSLASLCCAAVVFKNETSASVSVVFAISKISSGAIAPGSTWQWTPPNPESVVYHLGSDATVGGQIQIESQDG
jgi:hypothetical protein